MKEKPVDIELQRRKKLKNDFPFYAATSLKIRTKNDGLQPLILNRAQQYIHEKLEEQLERTGKVRAVILKGRQEGASTYIEARFMHKTTHKKGISAFILTHEDKATQNLFKMAKRYHSNLPPFIRPQLAASNANELVFGQMDSGYSVGTAGAKSVGRSSTNQLFHGSEVAFWANAAEHAKGIMQSIPDLPGTEIVYESTAKGMGNFFHQQWKMAEAGISEFIAIFVPWFWMDEYRKELPDDFVLSDDEVTIQDQYGLDDEQMYWRRMKIVELSDNGQNGLKAFKQEYPMNAAEAFQISGGDGLISSESVVKARKTKAEPSGPLVVGVDPSRGGDRFSTIKRAGRKAYGKQNYVGDEVDKLGKQVSICKQILDEVCPVAGKKPDMMFIDAGGGIDIVDRLHELDDGQNNYTKRVKAIYFGATPFDTKKYKNKRGEMWGTVNEWLNDEHEPVEIPDDDEMQADLCASPFNRDSHDRKVLWSKERIIAKYGFSPDDGDALGLTFAEPVKLVKSKKIKYQGWQ